MTIVRGPEADRLLRGSDAAAQFRASKDGTARIILRSDATRYDVAHELGHYSDWLADPAEFLSRGRTWKSPMSPSQKLEYWQWKYDAEKSVYDRFRGNDTIWERLNPLEQRDANRQMRYYLENLNDARKGVR